MEIYVLASGSKGNAISIKEEKTHLLVDIGVSFQVFKKKIEDIGIDNKSFTDLLITHEHIDHTKGLKMLLKNNNFMNIYLTRGTYNALGVDVRNEIKNFYILESEKSVKIGEFEVTPFSVSHDASEPVGFSLISNEKKIVIASDTGYIDEYYFPILKDADVYILEANHSPEMLMNSKRPFHLKQRIIGQNGHLSNQDAAWLVSNLSSKEKEVMWVVSHISEDCNSILEIEKSVIKVFDDVSRLNLKYTSQETSEKIIV